MDQQNEIKRYKKVMKLDDILGQSSLAQIMQKGVYLNELNYQLQQIFPSQFKGLYRLANIEQDNLKIEVANGSVRQGLLLQQQQLLKLVQQYYPEIQKISLKITPTLAR